MIRFYPLPNGDEALEVRVPRQTDRSEPEAVPPDGTEPGPAGVTAPD